MSISFNLCHDFIYYNNFIVLILPLFLCHKDCLLYLFPSDLRCGIFDALVYVLIRRNVYIDIPSSHAHGLIML